MRTVVQRVSEASVEVGPQVTIGPGLLILLAIAPTDPPEDLEWLACILIALRVFDDDEGHDGLRSPRRGRRVTRSEQWLNLREAAETTRIPGYVKSPPA